MTLRGDISILPARTHRNQTVPDRYFAAVLTTGHTEKKLHFRRAFNITQLCNTQKKCTWRRVCTDRQRENKCVGAIAEAVDTSTVPLDASGCQVSALANGRDKPPQITLLPSRLGPFAVFQAFVHHYQHGLRALACYLVTYKHKLQSGCLFFFQKKSQLLILPQT